MSIDVHQGHAFLLSGSQPPSVPSTAISHAGPLGGALKRLVDVLIAAVGLAVCLPLLIVVAVLIKARDGGPAFYVHPRIGYAGRRFGCIKFRTMHLRGNDVMSAHLRYSPAAAREWSETRKLKSDPRITELGMVLRKLSIDELPQLINVLLGHMSIVGPRPIVTDEMRMYGKELPAYLRTRPGVTGAWQISGRNDQAYERRVALDRDYVAHWSLWRDMGIILRTIPVVVAARGSY